MRRFFPLLLLVLLTTFIRPHPTSASFRLSMDIDPGEPVYTTLAAATERSRFTPDQAYHFRYDTMDEPTAFISRWAGDWGLVFAMDGEVVTAPGEMHRPWTIDAIRSDAVYFFGSPFEGIEVEAQFLVHASSQAYLSLNVRTTTMNDVSLTIASLIDEARLYSVWTDTTNTLHFSHDHPADSWTLNHGVPHPVRRYNELRMHPRADAAVLLSGLDGNAARLGLEWVQPDSTPIAPLFGRLTRPNGAPVNLPEANAQVIAVLEEDTRTLVSLDSPIRRHSWDNWKRRGYYALESGLLPFVARTRNDKGRFESVDSNTVRIVASLPGDGESTVGVYRRGAGSIGRTRHDLALTAAPSAAPRNLSVRETGEGLRLTWDGDSTAMYQVYWRHIKPRIVDQERATLAYQREDFSLARGFGVEVFRQQSQVHGTSHDVPLTRSDRRADGSTVQVPFDPASEPFARQYIVVLIDDDGLPVAASETVTHWPYPSLNEVLRGDEPIPMDSDAVVLPAVGLVKTLSLHGKRSRAPRSEWGILEDDDAGWQEIRLSRLVDESEAALARSRWMARQVEAHGLPSPDPPGQYIAHLMPSVYPVSGNVEQSRLLHSAATLLMQQMLPPEGQLSHPYYVFSREPTWGWGHGGQVFHESLAMLALEIYDPGAGVASMLNFPEAQRRASLDPRSPDGYIPYRLGPYLTETIPVDGEVTSSGPFYAWIVRELYRLTGEQHPEEFAQLTRSASPFSAFWLENRDTDSDSLLSWGGHAVLESLRDASAVVWDEVAPPDSLETVDLNSMLVSELTSLADLDSLLGSGFAGVPDPRVADAIARRVRTHLWDDETGFFYNIPKRIDGNATTPDPDRFTYEETDDLKRLEITGFLPLWAGIATEEQAERLVREHLLNPDEFWRPYGIPSLAASDPSYDPRGYWNGPVWVPWNYLVFRGLLRYGYVAEATELAERLSAGMSEVLGETHEFWEFYSAEEPWGGHHSSYIWSGLVLRMWWDLNHLVRVDDASSR